MNKHLRVIPVNVFFVELIIVLLFFSISIAAVLRMFAAASLKSVRSSSSERSLLCVQSVSEMYSVSGDMRETAEKIFGANSCIFGEDGRCTVYLDAQAMPLVVVEADIENSSENMIKFEMRENVRDCNSGKFSELYVTVRFLNSGKAEEFIDQKCCAYIPDFAGGAADEA